MRYFKVLDENNYIIAIGIGEGGEEIKSHEYNRLSQLLASPPEKMGYVYHLTNDCIWIAEEISPDELPDDVIKQKFLTEIMDSIEVDRKKPRVGVKEGFVLKQEYDPISHMIYWTYVEDPNYIRPMGTFFNPIEWIPWMNIVAGVNEDYVSDGWYIFEGLVQRCIKDGNPETFNDTEYWEVM